MSNIGKLKLHMPSFIKIVKKDFDLNFYTLCFIGKLGKISINLPIDFRLIVDNNSLVLDSDNLVMWGTTRNLIHQAIIGVTTGHSNKLELVGIGYKLSFNNNKISLYVGQSHEINIEVPKQIQINVLNATTLTATSLSYPLLTNFLHSIRLIKPASLDHYKGKGILVKKV